MVGVTEVVPLYAVITVVVDCWVSILPSWLATNEWLSFDKFIV